MEEQATYGDVSAQQGQAEKSNASAGEATSGEAANLENAKAEANNNSKDLPELSEDEVKELENVRDPLSDKPLLSADEKKQFRQAVRRPFRTREMQHFEYDKNYIEAHAYLSMLRAINSMEEEAEERESKASMLLDAEIMKDSAYDELFKLYQQLVEGFKDAEEMLIG